MLNLDFKEAVLENNMKRAMFDGIKEASKQIQKAKSPLDEKAFTVAMANMRMAGLSIVLELANQISSGDITDGMLPSELLDALMLEEIDDANVLNAVLSACITDAFVSLGCDEEMVKDAFDDDVEIADEALEGLSQTVIENLPDDGKPLDEFAKAFTYGEPVDDEVQYDTLNVGSKSTKKVNGHTITYKAERVIRDGKVTVVNKRVSGTVVLTAKQKAAMTKLHNKVRSQGSLNQASRSLKKANALGLVDK